MKETALTKIQYCRKETDEESESSSQKPSQKNDQDTRKQEETKVHFFPSKVDQSKVRSFHYFFVMCP